MDAIPLVMHIMLHMIFIPIICVLIGWGILIIHLQTLFHFDGKGFYVFAPFFTSGFFITHHTCFTLELYRSDKS